MTRIVVAMLGPRSRDDMIDEGKHLIDMKSKANGFLPVLQGMGQHETRHSSI